MCWSVSILVIYLSRILLCVYIYIYIYIYMVHSISRGVCFYFMRKSMFSIVYDVLHIQGGSNMTRIDLCVCLHKSFLVIFEPPCIN